MIYILKGQENYLIKEKIKDIIKDDKSYNVITLEGDVIHLTVDLLLDEVDNSGLFPGKKYVIVRNPFFLLAKAELKEEDENKLLRYINNPSKDADLILYEEDKTFLSNSKIYKAFTANAQVQDFSLYKPYDFKTMARNAINSQKIEIDNMAFDFLLNSSKGKLEKLYNYLDLLKLYDSPININNIRYLVDKGIEDDVFKLINSITDKDYVRSLTVLDDILTSSDSPLIIIAALASQLRYLYKIAYLLDNNVPIAEIKSITNTKNDYRLQMAQKTIAKYPKEELLATLHDLSILDGELKSNDIIDQKRLFELFIIKFIRRKNAIN